MKLADPVREMRTIKELLEGAEAESRRVGESMPGPEHLLLAALALPDGSARRVFERLGVDPDELRPAIAAQHAEALRAIGIALVDDEALDAASADSMPPARGLYRTTAPAQAAFRAAVDLAKTRKPSRLVGAHIVAAVAELEHGTAARTLRSMGIERHALAIAARQELESSPVAHTA
ncbi:MAG: Clp protease N-terminal domain-containing protein [Gaiellaceae bacterium]